MNSIQLLKKKAKCLGQENFNNYFILIDKIIWIYGIQCDINIILEKSMILEDIMLKGIIC